MIRFGQNLWQADKAVICLRMTCRTFGDHECFSSREVSQRGDDFTPWVIFEWDEWERCPIEFCFVTERTSHVTFSRLA